MKRSVLFVLILLLLFPLFSFQTDEWKKDVEAILFEFMSCGGPTSPNTPCNEFLAKALKRVYGISDFDKPGGGYILANQISNYVKLNTDKWTLLGKASTQSVLNEAQGYANVKKAVIAVYESSSGAGHVALILPGEQSISGQWGLNCPNSASFFLNKPDKAYISKHLGFAFEASKKDQVLIYGRNF